MAAVIYIAAAVVLILESYIKGIELLHMEQLEGYKPKQYWWWIKHNLGYLFLNEGFLLLFVAAAFTLIKFVPLSVTVSYIVASLWAVMGMWLTYSQFKNKKKAKKPLKYTHRAVRLFIFYFLLLFLWVYLNSGNYKDIATAVLIISAIRFVLPFNMWLSSLIMYPVEMALQMRYFHSAQTKIRGMKDLKVIGITGSYGKTSTKYFVKTLLSEKYNTLMTPESYNTPMGITRVIREQLTDKHEVFVCEMGARNIGDIKLLCKLVNPSIGILTSIGPQHLETFKTIKNVEKTKYELVEALPYYGTAIFNGDNKYCLELARKTGIETFIYGVENNEEDCYLNAKDIVNSRKGLKFKVCSKDGMEFECAAPILGRHNVSNLLAAICTAIKFGLTVEEIQMGISKIKPVPHRLQILDTNNGVTVIDDAFNSNPEGARQALETVKEFTGGKRIVVTPGMVELGSIEYRENKNFGKVMAECCDIAILIGVKRSKPIIEGLKEKNFPEENIIVTGNLNEATNIFGRMIKSGDVVLFENDLPDNYNEA